MSRRGSTVALALIVALAATAALPAASAAADGGAAFAESITTVAAGDTANVTVVVDGANATRRVHVGSNETNFVASATVVDADGDGRVSLFVDTAEAGTGNASAYLSVSAGDDLRAATQRTDPLDRPIEPGDYDLRLGPRSEPTDVGTLVVQRSDDGAGAERPPLPGDAADSAAITVLPTEANLTVEPATNRTIRGETAFAPGTNLSVRITAESGRKYLVVDTATVNDSGGFAASVDLDAATPGSTFTLTVVGPNETREAVPGRIAGTWVPPDDGSEDGGDGGSGDEPDEGGDAEPTTAGPYPLPDDPADTEAITVLPTEANLSLEAAPGRLVNGETALPAGTDLTIRMRSVQGRAFLRSTTAEVGAFGTFQGRFDLDGVPPGTTFVLTVRGPNGTVETVPGRIVPCESDCDAAETTPFPVDGFGVVAVAEATRGHPARIPINLNDRRRATLVVGGDAVNYRTAITVRDGNDDGRVVVGFDTAAAGDSAPTVRVVSDGDEGEVAVEEPDLPSLLDAAEYPLRLYPAGNLSADPIDTGRLVVYEAPAESGTDPARTSPTASATPAGGTAVATGSTAPGPLSPALLGVGGLAVGGVLALAGAVVLLGRR